MTIGELRKKSMALPKTPGVYLMKDAKNEIIYVGKAKALKNRVSSYFGSQNNHTAKVRKMVEHVNDFDYILTDSEFEALVLECSLIKQHSPKYNILLKDDKFYPFIKITTNETFPRVFVTRRFSRDGNKYFGQYANGTAVYETMDLIKRIFPLRTCKKNITETTEYTRPCLNYHIKKCKAPCNGEITKELLNEPAGAIKLYVTSSQPSSAPLFKTSSNTLISF